MTPRQLFIRGFLIPAGLLYAAFYAYVSFNELTILGRARALNYFRTDFVEDKLFQLTRDPDLVVLGDSGAKLGIDPRLVRGPFTVNFATYYGNALSSYERMKTFYQRRRPPNCVALILQFDWRRSYEDFFGNLVASGVFTFGELRDLWRVAVENDVFPATEFSAPVFWRDYALQSLYLHPAVFRGLQQRPRSWRRGRDMVRRLEGSRGHSGRTLAALDDGQFFREDVNAPLFRDFEPAASEDLFLRRLAALTREHGSKLYIGSVPLAASPQAERTAAFREGRRAHLRSLFAAEPHVRWLNFAEIAPREHFYDFTHPKSEGANALTAHLNRVIAGECAR